MPRQFILVAALALAALTLAGPTADAKPDYKGLTPNGRATLQSFSMYMKDCDPDKPPHKVKNDIVASDNLSKCERVIKNQRKRLDRIKGADRKHKVFVEFSAYQKRLEAAYPRWVKEHKDNRAAAGKLKMTAVAMKKDIGRHSGTIWFLKDIADGKPRLGQSDTHPAATAKRLEAGRAIAALAADCDGKYAPVLADKKLLIWASADRTPKPAASCELARSWKPLLTEWFPKAVDAYSEIKRKQYQGFVDDITKRGLTSQDTLELLTSDAMATRVSEMVTKYGPVASELGKPVAADRFAKWNEVAAQAPAAIKAASKVKRPRQKASGSKITKAIKAKLKGGPMKLVKLGVYSKQGKIIKNGVGIPLRKAWSGDALIRKKGEKFCRLYEVSAAAQYKGGGRYQKPVAFNLPRMFKISACK